MKYGDKTHYGSYYIKSMTRELKPKIQNESIRNQVSKIWLEHDEEENENALYIYMKEVQTSVYNVYDDVLIECTRFPNMFNDAVRNINDWLDEITIIKEQCN